MGTMKSTNVYCDNEELRDLIASIHPSSEGLYPHEIRMLQYISFGIFTNVQQNYNGTWKYQYSVDYPAELLKSLIQRGYIRECTDDELIDLIHNKEIRQLLKKRGLKCGRTIEENFSVLKSAFTGSDVYKELNYRYYVLTNEGEKALDNQYIDNPMNHISWYQFRSDSKRPKLKKQEINIIGDFPESSGIYKLYIDSKTLSSKLYFSDSSTTEVPVDIVNYFKKPSIVKIFVNDKQLIRDKGIDIMKILYCHMGILLGHRNKKNKIACKCYDIRTGQVITKGTVPEELFEYTSETIANIGYNYQKKGYMDNGKGVKTLRFYYSISNGLAETIVEKFLSQFIEVTRLEPFFPGDSVKKYRFIVDASQTEIQETLTYMYVAGLLEIPKIASVPVNTLMLSMMARSDNQVQQFIYDERFIRYRDYYNSIEQILDYYSQNTEAVKSDLEAVYQPAIYSCPDNMVFHPRLLYDYDIERNNVFHSVVTYKDVRDNIKKYRRKFNDLLNQLREEKTIDIKWVSEFNLYSLVKAIYDDAIYQCRFDWLGSQSLDIYIPKINTAIEYQGAQHYEPVTIFGGEEGFQKTQERDRRKKTLCKEHGVQLLYWPYTTEIKSSNLKAFLKSNNDSIYRPAMTEESSPSK